MTSETYMMSVGGEGIIPPCQGHRFTKRPLGARFPLTQTQEQSLFSKTHPRNPPPHGRSNGPNPPTQGPTQGVATKMFNESMVGGSAYAMARHTASTSAAEGRARGSRSIMRRISAYRSGAGVRLCQTVTANYFSLKSDDLARKVSQIAPKIHKTEFATCPWCQTFVLSVATSR